MSKPQIYEKYGKAGKKVGSVIVLLCYSSMPSLTNYNTILAQVLHIYS